MPATVTIKAVNGPVAGSELKFEEYTTCVIGRAPDCTITLPSDKDHLAVSRYHCLIDINPPSACIKDFGSLNGTIVNGRILGGRGKEQNLGQSEMDLKDGDRIKLGGTTFAVSIHELAFCVDCGAEIDESNALEEPVRCQACRDQAARDQITRIATISEEKHDVGLRIEGYTILRQLGEGGMGAVYLARENTTGRKVALKVMLPHVAVNERVRNLFMREARLTMSLLHQNIVRLFDSGCSDGTFFFTLEFCDGGSVDMLMAQRGGRLPVIEAIEIVCQALDGLEYAHQAPLSIQTSGGAIIHQKGLVHRDLKPANIFLSGSGASKVAKIADMGLSKSFRAAGLTGMTATGTAAGSPWYMPRQQVMQYKYSKPEVDVWGMAAALYNMLTGSYPRNFIQGRDPWLVVLQDPVIPIRQRNPQIPLKLAEVIDRALIDQPDILIKTAAEFKTALLKAMS